MEQYCWCQLICPFSGHMACVLESVHMASVEELVEVHVPQKKVCLSCSCLSTAINGMSLQWENEPVDNKETNWLPPPLKHCCLKAVTRYVWCAIWLMWRSSHDQLIMLVMTWRRLGARASTTTMMSQAGRYLAVVPKRNGGGWSRWLPYRQHLSVADDWLKLRTQLTIQWNLTTFEFPCLSSSNIMSLSHGSTEDYAKKTPQKRAYFMGYTVYNLLKRKHWNSSIVYLIWHKLEMVTLPLEKKHIEGKYQFWSKCKCQLLYRTSPSPLNQWLNSSYS